MLYQVLDSPAAMGAAAAKVAMAKMVAMMVVNCILIGETFADVLIEIERG